MEAKGQDADDKNPPQGMLLVYWERYGTAALVSFLGILAIEMVVFTPMIHFGVDVGPLMKWSHDTFGLGSGEVPGTAHPSWVASIVAAYVVTRVTKPITWPIAIALTPFIARVLGHVPKAE